MTEIEKMLAGKIYDPSDKELAEIRTRAHVLSKRYTTPKRRNRKSARKF